MSILHPSWIYLVRTYFFLHRQEKKKHNSEEKLAADGSLTGTKGNVTGVCVCVCYVCKLFSAHPSDLIQPHSHRNRWVSSLHNTDQINARWEAQQVSCRTTTAAFIRLLAHLTRTRVLLQSLLVHWYMSLICQGILHMWLCAGVDVRLDVFT